MSISPERQRELAAESDHALGGIMLGAVMGGLIWAAGIGLAVWAF